MSHPPVKIELEMPLSSTSSSSVPLIKGYLPVRLRLPPVVTSQRRSDDDDAGIGPPPGYVGDDTYFFVREHQGKATPAPSSAPTESTDAAPSNAGTAAKPGTTLFVANAPVVPGISTRILLKSIFGRFADVTRVTVVQTPRGGGDGTSSSVGGGATHRPLSSYAADGTPPPVTASTLSSSESVFFCHDNKDSQFYPSYLPPTFSEGKVAHVVFASAKEMKRAKRALKDLMAGRTQNKKKGGRTSRRTDDEDDSTPLPPALSLDKIEIQSLSDESLRRWEEDRRKVLNGHSRNAGADTDDTDDQFGLAEAPTPTRPPPSGLLAVAQRYRRSCNALSRDRLLQECNAVMEAYEEADLARRRAQEAARSQPDDDGFVTVTYSGGGAVGTKSEMEESLTATTPNRRKGNKRTRKKKEAAGSAELKDFYRFQRKENRKRTMDDLRKQFDEDLKRVRRLKEEKQYRPF